MNRWLVALRLRGDHSHKRLAGLLHEARLVLGPDRASALEAIDTETFFEVELSTAASDVEQLTELFADPVLETAELIPAAETSRLPAPRCALPYRTVTVVRRPGVMDPPALSAMEALSHLGLPATKVRIARRYLLLGDTLSDQDVNVLARRMLASDVIDQVLVDADALPENPDMGGATPSTASRGSVKIRNLDDAELEALSQERLLALNLAEMHVVRDHYQAQQREPTDVELETIAQTWSEHCKHKTFRSNMVYVEKDSAGNEVAHETISDLLDSTIVAATRHVIDEAGRDDTVSLFVDNAGVVRFDATSDICAKVETHNHPSAIEPYGGSGTGVGGVIRDILGTGKGARPLLNLDVFCLGPPDLPSEDLPRGSLHPRQVLAGVVAGVRDYGNRMGIPTASGALAFHPGYVGNPLVFCGTVGILPRNRATKAAEQGDHVVVVGGRTGRDGIHGATFSSLELSSESETVSSGAVQIGNAIEEKKVADLIEAAREAGLINAITDCGAGGLSSAVGEMGEEIGADVDLSLVPIKYAGLTPAEIWISEAQERMVIAVPRERGQELVQLFARETVEATIIGHFGTTGSELIIRYAGEEMGRLAPEFLHGGLPRWSRPATWQAPVPSQDHELLQSGGTSHLIDLHRVLADLDVASKEWVIRQYDHEVQGGAALRPLCGPRGIGPQDATAVVPNPGTSPAAAALVGLGLCPGYGEIDPYSMATAAVDEALRNLVASGGDPRRTSLLDNFCWGDPGEPEQLGSLVRAARGAADAARAFGCPFISGKDSLNNTYRTHDGRRVSIPGTLLITAVGVVPDVRNLVSMEWKRPGDVIFVVGHTRPELGGGALARTRGVPLTWVPTVDLDHAPRILAAVASATAAGLVRSAHDLSEGGLAVALAESCLASDLGARVTLDQVPWSPSWRASHPEVGLPEEMDPLEEETLRLFSESPTRLLVSVAPENRQGLEVLLEGAGLQPGHDFAAIGEVRDDDLLVVEGLAPRGPPALETEIGPLRDTWRRPLFAVFGLEPPPLPPRA